MLPYVFYKVNFEPVLKIRSDDEDLRTVCSLLLMEHSACNKKLMGLIPKQKDVLINCIS